MVPLVAPWLTGLMKVVSSIVVTLYVYVVWRVARLMATGMLPLGLIALAAVCLCYAIVFNAVMATLETRRMSTVFGEDFARYRARVRAFVPLPRR